MVSIRAQSGKPPYGAMLTITAEDSAVRDDLAQLRQRMEDLTEPLAEDGERAVLDILVHWLGLT